MSGASAQIMASRVTADGVAVQFWTDGAVTSGSPRGHMPIVARDVARRLAWLVAGEVCICDADEIKPMVRAARAAWNAYATHPRFAGAPMPDDTELRRLMRSKFQSAAHRDAGRSQNI